MGGRIRTPKEGEIELIVCVVLGWFIWFYLLLSLLERIKVCGFG